MQKKNFSGLVFALCSLPGAFGYSAMHGATDGVADQLAVFEHTLADLQTRFRHIPSSNKKNYPALPSSNAHVPPPSQTLVQTFRISDTTNLVIELGDILQSPTEAIVNAANPQLHDGGGVCGAIFQAAGKNKLQAACDEYPVQKNVRCPVGEARITDSFDLRTAGIRYIIHAVGPDCRIITDTQEQNRLLTSAYTNALILADQQGITSIAFPFISAAIYACPAQQACATAVQAVVQYVTTHQTTIQSVRFVLFKQNSFDLFSSTLQHQLPLLS